MDEAVGLVTRLGGVARRHEITSVLGRPALDRAVERGDVPPRQRGRVRRVLENGSELAHGPF